MWLDEVIGQGEHIQIGCYVDVCAVGREIPHRVVLCGSLVAWVGVAPDQLLYWVVIGQADQGRLSGGSGLGSGNDGICASVLDLLNQVLMALLSETAALLGIQIYVVGPDLEGGLEEGGEQR